MQQLKGHGSKRTVYALAFAPDGATLASCGLDATVRLWDLATGADRVLESQRDFRRRSLAFSPDGRVLAWVGSRGLSVWLAETNRPHPVAPLALRGASPAHQPQVCFSPDGKTLVCVFGVVRHWGAASLRELPAWPDSGDATGAVAFAPDGRTLATGHTSRHPSTGRLTHTVRIWDAVTRRQQTVLTDVSRMTSALAFAPNGRRLAAVCQEYLQVWDLPAAQPAFSTKLEGRFFQSVAFTPDGRWLAATHNDKTVRLWETASWAERAAFDWGVGAVVSLAFAPDGMRAAVGGKSGKIVVWDVDL